MTNRIDWLDTAKGIAMLMVVLQHTTGIDGYRIGLINAHISLPLFFLISGYFFKPKQCFSEFIKNKITTLLIPAVFFYWLGCFLFLTMQSVGVRVVIPFEWLRFLDIFLDTENLYCNGVVWFLIALFWICCICYVLQKAKPISLICISLLISVLSANGGGYLPAYADSALSCLIFYVIGMVLRSKNILNTLQINKMTIGLAFVGGCIITLFSHRIFIAHNYYEHPLLFHAASFGGITFLLTLCRIIGRIPLITSIYGRYSLIVLGTHALLIYPVRRFSITFITGDIGSIVTFIVVAMAEIAVVPLFIRLFPYVCAQKSIFDYLKSKNSTLIS